MMYRELLPECIWYTHRAFGRGTTVVECDELPELVAPSVGRPGRYLVRGCVRLSGGLLTEPHQRVFASEVLIGSGWDIYRQLLNYVETAALRASFDRWCERVEHEHESQ